MTDLARFLIVSDQTQQVTQYKIVSLVESGQKFHQIKAQIMILIFQGAGSSFSNQSILTHSILSKSQNSSND